VTHTLHRCGNRESLEGDYILLCTPAKDVNAEGAREKLLRILDIVMEAGPSNIGFYGHGSTLTHLSIDEVKRSFHDHSRVRACFDSKDKLKGVLRRLRDEDLGLSVTVSGLIDEIAGMSAELGLEPHTINISCGVFGKTERLPANETLELATMCGHGIISHKLVEEVVVGVKRGEIDLDDAVKQVGIPCTCGIYNPTRAREILGELVGKDTEI
jgi:hypothetical protein